MNVVVHGAVITLEKRTNGCIIGVTSVAALEHMQGVVMMIQRMARLSAAIVQKNIVLMPVYLTTSEKMTLIK